MRIALFAAALALAGCDRGQVTLDMEAIGPARSLALPRGPAAGPDAVELDIEVSGSAFKAALDRRARIDLQIVDCGAPDGPAETFPVYFATEAVIGLVGSQVSGDREMTVGLNASVPRAALERAQPCGRFVGRPGMMAPEVVSRPVPLRQE